MKNTSFLFFIVSFFLYVPCSLKAQNKVDTIVVIMSGDDAITTSTDTNKKTPQLDLSSLQSPKKDSLTAREKALLEAAQKRAELEKKQKEDAEQKRLAKLRLEEENKKKKEEAELKRKLEQEKREIEKRKLEQDIAEKKRLAELEKEKEKEKLKEKDKIPIVENKIENKTSIDTAERDNTAVIAPIEIEKNEVVEPSQGEINLQERAPTLPEKKEIPAGISQKDNAYGTVRIAFDALAASFLLSIPTETKMHYHEDHTEQLLLIEGQGMVLLGYKTIQLKKNELIFITKGTPHKIINQGKTPLKVLSIQSPFHDGSDHIILE